MLTWYKTVFFLCVFISIAGLSSYWRSNAIQYKTQRDELIQSLAQASTALNELQQRQRDIAALDARYTRELTNARLENDRLRDDVAAGRRQLRIKGTCKLSETTASSGMGNGSTIEVSGETGSTVFDIRSGIISDQQKLKFLQEYVKTQCH